MAAHPVPHPSDGTLQDYGLGRLDDPSAESIGRHLEGCPACRHRVAELSSDSFLGRLREAHGRPESLAPVASSETGRSGRGREHRSSGPSPGGASPAGLAGCPDHLILRELGRGGMGAAYLAQNTLMGRHEVLKVIGGRQLGRNGAFDRLLAEIRNAAELSHPHIVTIYSAVRSGDDLVLTMEYVEGFDLTRVVQAKGPLPVAHACHYVHQVALGLQCAHERGMVHHNIKPGNLILGRQGNKGVVKILDFGLARAGRVAVAPDFLAPEQTTDPGRADIRADIYGLGCTLYFLLTGNPPFQGANLYDILQAHQSMEAIPLNLARPDVPMPLAVIVATMMAKEPGRRFRTPGEVSRALAPFLKKENAPPARSTPAPPPADASSDFQLSQGTDRAAAARRVNLTEALASPRAKPAEATSSGSEWEALIEIRPEDDLSEEVQTLLEERRSRARAWPVAAGVLGLAGLLVLAVALGMSLGAKQNQGSPVPPVPSIAGDDRSPTRPAAPTEALVELDPPVRASDAFRSRGDRPARSGRSIEPSPAAEGAPSPRASRTESASDAVPSPRESTVASNDVAKRPDRSEEAPRDRPSLADQDRPVPKPDPKPVASDKVAGQDPGRPPDDDDPESILIRRGLRKRPDGKKICYIVATEDVFHEAMNKVRPVMNRLLAAYEEWARAREIQIGIQRLDIEITNTQFNIRELSARQASLPNNPPGRFQKGQLQQQIDEQSAYLGDCQRQFVILNKQKVSPPKMEELKRVYLEQRAGFQAAARELHPIHRKLYEEYAVLSKDEALNNARRLLGERSKASVKLGPLSQTVQTMRNVVQLERDVSDDQDAFRSKKKSTRLEGRDAPKGKVGAMRK